MTNYYDYITGTGVIVPDVDSVQADIQSEFQDAFGVGLSSDPTTPQGRLIEIETLGRQLTIGMCALVANQLNIEYATGQFLDALGALFGVKRFGATNTRVLATINGVPNTIIPKGAKAGTTLGDVFILENDVVIPVSGQITAYFLSEEKGAVSCAINTLTNIITQTIGWESVSNPAAAIIGENHESDFSYKKRIKNARFTGISLLESIKGAINIVPNVQSSFVYDNDSNQAITYQDITIPAHSILIMVDGGNNEEIAKAILQKKSSGSGYTSINGQSVTVPVADGAYGVNYNVTFNRPVVLLFDVKVSVRANTYIGDNLSGAIKNAILNWANGLVDNVDGLKIGQNVSPFEIGAAISDQLPDIQIKSVLIAHHGQTLSANELTCKVSQIYQIQEANIIVEEV